MSDERRANAPKAARDWVGLRSRLANAASAFAASDVEASSGSKRQLLERRTRALATPAVQADVTRARLELVEFSLADSTYALPSAVVQEVAVLRQYGILPFSSPHVLGFFQLRGRMMLLLDLRKFWGIKSGGITNLNRTIVLGPPYDGYALLADAVSPVSTLFVDELAAPADEQARRSGTVRGISSAGVAVLDAERLFSALEIGEPRNASSEETLK